VPIIRRNNCIYVIFGICHSVWMTVWYAGYPVHQVGFIYMIIQGCRSTKHIINQG